MDRGNGERRSSLPSLRFNFHVVRTPPCCHNPAAVHIFSKLQASTPSFRDASAAMCLFTTRRSEADVQPPPDSTQNREQSAGSSACFSGPARTDAVSSFVSGPTARKQAFIWWRLTDGGVVGPLLKTGKTGQFVFLQSWPFPEDPFRPFPAEPARQAAPKRSSGTGPKKGNVWMG